MYQLNVAPASYKLTLQSKDLPFALFIISHAIQIIKLSGPNIATCLSWWEMDDKRASFFYTNSLICKLLSC